MKKYVFYNLIENSNISEDLLDYQIINFNLLNLELKNKSIDWEVFERIRDKEVYFYSSSIKNIEKIYQKNMSAHYCFINDSILNLENWIFLKNQKAIEIFWVITENLNKQNIEKYLDVFNKFNLPICFYVTGLLVENNLNYDFKLNMEIIKEINYKWKNPLYEKEISLVDLVYEENFYMDNRDRKEKPLLMGLFGDIQLEEDKFKDMNIKNMLKIKSCRNCEYFDACKARNMGIFFKQLNYFDCLGFKILGSDT